MAIIRKIENAFFEYQPELGLGWFPRAWIILLFLGGIAFWGYFLNWGNINFHFQDWAEISAPRIAFVQDAVIKGTLPLHMPDSSALRSLTDRFFVIPDVTYSPQMLLLSILSVGQFVVVNTLFFYTLSVLALLWLRRRFQLSPAVYTLLFLMVSFNGYIQSHLGIGHESWLVYFLFPWLIVLAIQVLDAPRGWSWVAATSFLLFFMLINGGIHQYTWSLMFLGLLAIAAYRRFWVILAAMVFTGLLGAVRLLPPILGMGSFDHEFITGFPTLRLMASGFISLVDPALAYKLRTIISPDSYTGFWELDIYVGKAGGLALFLGGLVWLIYSIRKKQYLQIWAPTIILGALTLDGFFKPFQELPFPLFNAERVSSRMIAIPFLVAAIMGAIYFQVLLKGIRWKWVEISVKGASLALIGLTANDLYRHAAVWQVNTAAKAFDFIPVDLALKVVSNHPDPTYFQLLWIGGAISLLTGLFLIGMTWRERRKVVRVAEVDQSLHLFSS